MAIRLMDVSIDDNGDIIVSERSHRKAEDVFIWQADESTVGSFTIDFDGSWPFDPLDDPTPQPGGPGMPVSLTVDKSAPSKDYKYTVSAVDINGDSANDLDPHIIVDNMGGADGTTGVHVAAVQAIGEGTFKSVVETLVQLQGHTKEKDAGADGKRFFFPFGIQSIAVAVTGPARININIKVSGETVA
jgi:hypothetical protein